MSEYSAIPSTGKLKLKGVKDSRVDKKKKKKKPKDDAGGEHHEDNSVVLQHLREEDAQIEKDVARVKAGGKEATAETTIDKEEGEEDMREHIKTDAEKRYDEQRRKRLEERLKREGVKTHKERVEELNRYLSTLSEHHDMPKIGPG